MDLWLYLLNSWKTDRLSEKSKKHEEGLDQEGFIVVLENARATGSVVTIGGIIYVQMVGDVILSCEELRTPRVIARELSFPFRENKNLHDEATGAAPEVQDMGSLPNIKDAGWDSGLQELMREHQERKRNF